MAHYCPLRNIRLYPENCKKICPKTWMERLIISPEGRLRCIGEKPEREPKGNKLTPRP